MKKSMVWENNEFFGIEYMELSFLDNKIDVDSTVISIENNIPYKINYNISLDTDWVVKKLHIDIGDSNKSLKISSNGKGQWFDIKGNEIHELDGAIDIDISCTPFTNSLPINRFEWDHNTSKNFEMVFISIPDMTYKKVKQSYTLIKDTVDSREFQYKSGTYETKIEVDINGLVITYPGVFTRKF
ncbi:putative glycolipid-binding domain-containing protein [Viridibacillus sp. NPDC096237]|uniref:putative glycolipid-binding domain-containing protein n=1 Tax=Viridibacillus sp. NPDC096237 TaxID=3390721 RepID=UPI003D04D007